MRLPAFRLRHQLAVVYGIAALFVFGLSFFIAEYAVTSRFREFQREGQDRSARELLSFMAALYEESGSWTLVGEHGRSLLRGRLYSIRIRDREGRTLFAIDRNRPWHNRLRSFRLEERRPRRTPQNRRPFPDAESPDRRNRAEREPGLHGTPANVEFFRYPFIIAGRQGGEAELGMFPQRGLPSLVEEVFLEEISTVFFYAAIAAVLLFSLLGFLLSRGFSRPLEQLARGARAVAAGDLADVSIRGGGELRELAESFHRMVRRLAERDELQRRMTSDIAHELRTPVSILQSHLEGMAEGVMPATPQALASLREETTRLNRIIDDLKAIWEIERSSLDAEIVVTPLAPLVEATVARFRPLAAERGIQLALAMPATEVPVALDGHAFDRALGNVIGNALRYAAPGPEGKPPLVEVEIFPENENPSITVRDSGPGIPEADLERVFERFYRVDMARDRQSGGAGLGLAIAREALQAMGGSIVAGNAPTGGACFTISLKRAR